MVDVTMQAAPQFASQQPAPLHLVALLTCFNRRDKTIALLQSLARQQPFPATLSIVVVDDGCTDGTGDAVRAAFPTVHLVEGDGSLFWAGGMRLAQRYAFKQFANIDYLLWLNDDVVLDDDALVRLLAQAASLRQPPQRLQQHQSTRPLGALVGAVRSPETMQLSYGGRRLGPWWAPLRYSRILPSQSTPRPCDLINGNVCLLPVAAVEHAGELDHAFTHSMADFDYGLRLRHAGFALYQAAGSYGQCKGRPIQGSIRDKRLPLATRRAMLQRPNHAAPVAQWQLFVQRYGGPFRWLLVAKAQLRAWFPTWYLKLIEQTPEPKRVVVVQPQLKHYRLAFWNALQQRLAADHIELFVLYGEPDAVEQQKKDAISSPPAPWFVPTIGKQFGPLQWQYHPLLKTADIVVCEHAVRTLLPWYLTVKRIPLIWWGHGYDHQGRRSGITAWWRRQLLGLGRHYLAYTEPVQQYVVQQGVATSQVTVVNNSQDCHEVANACALRRAPTGPLVAIFCGSLYSEKRLELLLESAERAVAAGVLQRLIVVGDGPQRHLIEQAQSTWLDHRGALFAHDKAKAYAEADVVLNPGLTGLAILDAFAAGLPYVTCHDSAHSPEIAYLQHGVNGFSVDGNSAALLAALSTLCHGATWRQMAAQARLSATTYGLAAMVDAYRQGVTHALGMQSYDVCLIHQAYRVRGGEDVVVARDQQWLQRQGLRVCLHQTQWPAEAKWMTMLRFVARLLWPLSVQQIPNASCYWLHNTQGSYGTGLATQLKQRPNAVVWQTLHNMRLLWPGGVFKPDEWHGPSIDSVKQAWLQRPYRQSRLLSVLMALSNLYRRDWHQAVDVVICPSDHVRSQYLRAGIDSAKLQRKPHWCPSSTNPTAQKLAQCSSRPLRFLYVGRNDHHKGLPWLLEVWSSCSVSTPCELRLVVPTATTAQVAPHVSVSTAHSWAQLSEHYQWADVVVVPSLVAETFGNVVIEAYAHGCILLCSQAGALPEVAATGPAFLFKAGDPIDFKRQFDHVIAALRTDSTVADAHSQQAIATWRAYYSEQAQPIWPVHLIEQLRRS